MTKMLLRFALVLVSCLAMLFTAIVAFARAQPIPDTARVVF